jgi:hypothetical protein
MACGGSSSGGRTNPRHHDEEDDDDHYRVEDDEQGHQDDDHHVDDENKRGCWSGLATRPESSVGTCAGQGRLRNCLAVPDLQPERREVARLR